MPASVRFDTTETVYQSLQQAVPVVALELELIALYQTVVHRLICKYISTSITITRTVRTSAFGLVYSCDRGVVNIIKSVFGAKNATILILLILLIHTV